MAIETISVQFRIEEISLNAALSEALKEPTASIVTEDWGVCLKTTEGTIVFPFVSFVGFHAEGGWHGSETDFSKYLEWEDEGPGRPAAIVLNLSRQDFRNLLGYAWDGTLSDLRRYCESHQIEGKAFSMPIEFFRKSEMPADAF